MNKKIILSILTICAISFPALAEVITVNETKFPDANFRSYLIKNYRKAWTTDKIETDNVKSINLENTKIETFKGIEYLTNLREFRSKTNGKVSSVDFSKNTLLKDVDMRFNTKLTSVTLPVNIERVSFDGCDLAEFDATLYNNLYMLSLIDNSRIKEMDITQCPKLRYFSLTNSKIQDIDLSQNPNLEYVILSYNRGIRYLDLSNNPAIESLWFDHCSLAKIDLSNNPNIVNANPSMEKYTVKTSQGETNIYGFTWDAECGYNDKGNVRSGIPAETFLDNKGNYVNFIHKTNLENELLAPNFLLSEVSNWNEGCSFTEDSGLSHVMLLTPNVENGTVSYTYPTNMPQKSRATLPDPVFTFEWEADFNNLTTAIDNVNSNNDIKVYATNGTIHVEGDINTTIKVFNINGSTIFEGNQSEINVAPGLYLVKVNNKTSKLCVK